MNEPKGKHHSPRRLARFALAFALMLGGCDGAEDNRLIGTWRLVDGSDCTLDQIIFTAGNVISRNGPGSYSPGRESTVPVTYSQDGPDRVTATNRDQATSVTYVLSDENHMFMGDNRGCAFERV
jgi:hypothetical protein